MLVNVYNAFRLYCVCIIVYSTVLHGSAYTVVRATQQWEMKKALRETQTLRAGCSKAEPKFFAPPGLMIKQVNAVT